MRVAPAVIGIWAARGLGAIVATWLMRLAIRRLGLLSDRVTLALQTRVLSRGRGWAVRSVEVVSQGTLLRSGQAAVSFTRVLLQLTVFYIWLLAAAWLLDASRRVFDTIVKPLTTAFTTIGQAVVTSLPNLAYVVAIIAVARFATRTLALFADAAAAGKIQIFGLDRDLATPTRRVATLAVWLFAIVMLVPYVPGSDSRAFQAVAIVLGVLLSLGSSSVVSNLLSGLVITYAKSYRVGERVRIGEVLGEVRDLGTFATRIRTADGQDVVIPNVVVQAGVVRNFSRLTEDTGLPLRTTVRVHSEISWKKVHETLLASSSDLSFVQTKPAPFVLQRGADSGLVAYTLCVHLTLSDPFFADPMLGDPLERAETVLHQRVMDGLLNEAIAVQ